MKPLIHTLTSSLINKHGYYHIAALCLQKVIYTHLHTLYPHLSPTLYIQCKYHNVRILTYEIYYHRIIRLYRNTIVTQRHHACNHYHIPTAQLPHRLSFGDPSLYLQGHTPSKRS